MLTFSLKLKKVLTYVMLKELAFQKCKKTHQNPYYLMSNGLLNLDDKFCHALQNSWIWTCIL
jgi:hypothetical protein